MKKIILTVACFIAISSIVRAQEVIGTKAKKEHQGKAHDKVAKTPEVRAQKSVDELNAKVTLTEAQKTSVQALALDRAILVDGVKAKYKGQSENKETAKKEIETIRKMYREKLKALLTAEQLEKLKAEHKAKKAQGKPEQLLDDKD